MRYEIKSPVAGFSGEVAGVAFTRGTATLDAGRQGAALAYFARKGYTVEAADRPTEELEPAGPFDPNAHDVAAVLAHLDAADETEFARVLAAETDGKARKTILARERATEQNGAGQ